MLITFSLHKPSSRGYFGLTQHVAFLGWASYLVTTFLNGLERSWKVSHDLDLELSEYEFFHKLLVKKVTKSKLHLKEGQTQSSSICEKQHFEKEKEEIHGNPLWRRRSSSYWRSFCSI